VLPAASLPLSDDAPALWLRLRRDAEAELQGRPAFALGARDALLLAWLAVEGPTPRERLGALLWPQSSQSQARTALRQRLFQLRRVLGREVASGGPVLALAAGVEHDLGAADELLGHLRLSDAAELDAWLVAQREQRRARHFERLRAQAQALEQASDAQAALPLAEEMVRLEPLSEAAHQRVMRLHYLGGDNAQALAAFDRCERLLKDELGTRPSTATLELLATIEHSITAPRPAGTLPVAVLRPPRLVGREGERAAFEAAWRERAPVLVTGEAGIGKTRFVAECTAGSAGVLRVAAHEGDATVPYALLTRLLRAVLARPGACAPPALARELAHLLPELGAARPWRSELDRARFLGAVETLLGDAAVAGVPAIVVDDLHWADAASLEGLRHAVLATPGLVWVLVSRPDAVDAPARPVAALTGGALGALETRGARRLERLELAPLSDAELLQLVDTLGLPQALRSQAAGALVQIARGNPLWLLETLKALWPAAGEADSSQSAGPTLAALTVCAGALPQRLAPLIAQRLRALSARALDLARCAAVSGQEFDAELAAVVLQVRAIELADAWGELERAQVLRGTAFAHDLLAEAVRASMPAPVLHAVHAQVAAWLEAHGASPGRIAWHHECARQSARAAPHWLAAGHAAVASLRHGEAATAFERAAYGFAAAGERASAFVAACEMRQSSFHVDLGGISTTALELLERYAATPAEHARSCNERAVVALHRGDLDRTESDALAGLAALGAADEPLLRAELRRNIAAVRLWRGDTQGALAELRSVEHDIERLAPAPMKALFGQSLAIVLEHADQSEAGHAAAAQATARFLADGDVPSAVQTLLNDALAYHDSGDLAQALATLERARSLHDTLPERFHSYSSMELNFGFVLTGLGDYARALHHLERAAESARAQTPGWMPLVAGHRAQLWLHLGQVARARQELRAAEPDGATPPMARNRWLLALAQIGAERVGEQPVGTALAELSASVAPQGRRLSRWRAQVAQLLHMQPGAALSLAESLWDEIERTPRHGLAIVLAARLASLLARAQGAEAARPYADRALAAMPTSLPDQAYRGEIWLRCLPVLRVVDRARHDTLLKQACAWIELTAHTRVPPQMRDAFVEGHAENRALRAMRALGSG